jgi:hypothetical protein
MMRRRTVLGAVATGSAGSLAGCASVLENANSSYENGRQIACSGDAYPDRIEFDCRTFDGEAGRVFRVDAGTTVDLSCRTDIDGGRVRFHVTDPGDEVRWAHEHEGATTHETSASVEATSTGRYTFGVVGEDVDGEFAFEWLR